MDQLIQDFSTWILESWRLLYPTLIKPYIAPGINLIKLFGFLQSTYEKKEAAALPAAQKRAEVKISTANRAWTIYNEEDYVSV